MTTDSNNIRIEDLQGGIRILWINRPKVLNALNLATLNDLRAALLDTEKNREIRALILSGEGEKAFIAGADIAEMSLLSSAAAVAFSKRGHEVAALLETLPIPTIAAVNGFALGGGTEMATACDFILCSENAVFGQPEVCLGITPGFGATFRLARFVGWPRAKELIFSGRRLKAEEAKEMGIVNHVYPQAQLMVEAKKLAEQMVANSASAIAWSKKLINEYAEPTGLNYKMDSEAQVFGGLFGGHDQKEGMTAFLEKRKAEFERQRP